MRVDYSNIIQLVLRSNSKNEPQLLQTHNAVTADDESVCIDLRFGVQHRYDLRHVFPLLTTKRVFWRGVF